MEFGALWQRFIGVFSFSGASRSGMIIEQHIANAYVMTFVRYGRPLTSANGKQKALSVLNAVSIL